MNPETDVRERRLTAVLEEVVGGGCPRDLEARVLERVRATPPRRRGASLLAALCMLGGIAVVVATARWREGMSAAVGSQDPAPKPPAPQDPAPKVQEPAKVTVTMAMVHAAVVPVVAPPPGDGVVRLLALANRGPFAIVVAPGVGGESKADIEGLTWHEAVAHVADELGVGTAEYGNVVVVGVGPRVPKLNLRVTLSKLPAIDVREVPRALHRGTGMNLVVADAASGTVEFDVVDVPARALLDLVAARLSLQVVGCGSVLAIRPAVAEPAPPRLAMNLRNRAIADVFDTWAKLAGRNLVIDPGVQGVVSLRASAPRAQDLLAALAAAVGAEVQWVDRGIVRVRPKLSAPETVTWTTDARGGSESAAEVAARIGLPEGLLAASGSPAKSIVIVAQAAAADVMRAFAVATGQRWLRREKDYVIE